MKGFLVGHPLLRSFTLQVGIIPLLAFLGIMGLRNQGVLESLELEAYDWSLRLRPHAITEIPPITLVAITDQDIGEIGHWPISDDLLARALTRIHALRPRAIGVDIYRDLDVPPGRAALNRILGEYPEITMVMKFGKPEEGGIVAPAILLGTDRVGFTDMVVDSDGVVRRGLLFLDDGTNFYSSFSFLLA